MTFRGHQVPEFVSAVEADPSVIDSLHRFAADHLSLLGGDHAYLASNAGRELGRFLQYPSLRGKARPWPPTCSAGAPSPAPPPRSGWA